MAVLKTKGTVFSHTDRPRPVNNLFIFFCFFFCFFFRWDECKNVSLRLEEESGNKINKIKINLSGMFIESLILFSLANQYVKKEKKKHLRVIEMTIMCQTLKVDEC